MFALSHPFSKIQSMFSQSSPSLQKKTTHTAPAPNQFKDKLTPRYFNHKNFILDKALKKLFQFGVWYWRSSLGSIFWMSSMAGNCCRPFTCRCKIKETIQIFKTQTSLDYVVRRQVRPQHFFSNSVMINGRTFANVSSAELKGLEEGLTSPGSTIHRKTR